MTTQQLATFSVDRYDFGVEVATVQEVLGYQEMTRVPLAPPAVGGLLNLRGQVIPAIDLRNRLGLTARPADALPVNVVVRSDDDTVSLLVDRVGEVVDAAREDFEHPPETLSGPGRELIRGAYKLDGCLLLALDVRRAIDTSSGT